MSARGNPPPLFHGRPEGVGVMFASWDDEPALSIRNLLRSMEASAGRLQRSDRAVPAA